MFIIEKQLQKRVQVIEKQLEKQLQAYYSDIEEPKVTTMWNDADSLFIRVYFKTLFINEINETEEDTVLIGKIVSNRIKRVFDLMYYSDNILNCQFHFNFKHYGSFLTLLVKDDIENIEKIVEKLFNTIIIVLSKDTVIHDEDVKLYNHKRSILDTDIEFSLLKIAYDNGIDDGEYYDSNLPDLALKSYINNDGNVFLSNDKTLTIDDFKKFCLLLDKEYNIILGDKK